MEALRHFLDTLPHVAHSGLGELLEVGDGYYLYTKGGLKHQGDGGDWGGGRGRG